MHQKRPQMTVQLKRTHRFHSPNKSNLSAGYFLPADAVQSCKAGAWMPGAAELLHAKQPETALSAQATPVPAASVSPHGGLSSP